MSFPWTPESETQLLALYEKGDSMSLIARQLGKGLTRNAVCGKLHRLGAVRPERSRAETIIAGLASRKAQKPRTPPKPPRPTTTPPDPPTPVRAPENSPGAAITLMGLQPRHCRWPIAGNGADTVFCAKPTHASSWCVEHNRLAWQPTKPGWKRLWRISGA